MKMNRTVRDFQNAMVSLLGKVPFSKMTVDQICKEALLHRSSFYRYFRDKYDLLEQTLEIRLGQMIDEQGSEQAIVSTLIHYVNSHKEVFYNLAGTEDHTGLHGEFLRILSEILLKRRDSDSHDAILEALRHSEEPEILAYVISGGIIGTFYWWREHNYDVSEQEMIDFALGLMKTITKVEKNEEQ